MIETFTPALLPACAALYAEVFHCAPWRENWTTAQAAQYLSEFIESARFQGFVFLDQGQVLGAAFCHGKTWQDHTQLFVDELYVSTSQQGSGIGSALMAAVEDYASAQGMVSVVLLTSSEKPAMRFYRGRGYACAEEYKFLYKEL